jgi:hypothetical protein
VATHNKPKLIVNRRLGPENFILDENGLISIEKVPEKERRAKGAVSV